MSDKFRLPRVTVDGVAFLPSVEQIDPGFLVRERAAALREAADEVRTEARWQESLRVRGCANPSWRESIDRLLMLERVLDGRAASLVSPSPGVSL